MSAIIARRGSRVGHARSTSRAGDWTLRQRRSGRGLPGRRPIQRPRRVAGWPHDRARRDGRPAVPRCLAAVDPLAARPPHGAADRRGGPRVRSGRSPAREVRAWVAPRPHDRVRLGPGRPRARARLSGRRVRGRLVLRPHGAASSAHAGRAAAPRPRRPAHARAALRIAGGPSAVPRAGAPRPGRLVPVPPGRRLGAVRARPVRRPPLAVVRRCPAKLRRARPRARAVALRRPRLLVADRRERSDPASDDLPRPPAVAVPGDPRAVVPRPRALRRGRSALPDLRRAAGTLGARMRSPISRARR